MPFLDRLLRRRLIVVTGKGGVGKSALTAALGRRLAAEGRRILLLEVDPRENLHQLCGVPPSGGEIAEVGDGLWLQNLKPKAVVDRVVEKQIKIELLAKRVLASPVYERFVEGAPGLTEIAIMGHALRVVRGDEPEQPPIDTVILDAPATGHGIYLLTAARLFTDVIPDGPFGRLAGEVADFVDHPEDTGLVLATLAEEMPVQEVLELRGQLREKLDREPDLLVVNGLYPPVPPDSEFSEDDGELLALWRPRREMNEREIERLERDWDGAIVRLPLLATPDEHELILQLSDLLTTGEGAEEREEE